jgi:hypothetical protein
MHVRNEQQGILPFLLSMTAPLPPLDTFRSLPSVHRGLLGCHTQQVGTLNVILVAKCRLPLFLIKYGGSCILTLLSGRIDSTAQAIFLHEQCKV